METAVAIALGAVALVFGVAWVRRSQQAARQAQRASQPLAHPYHCVSIAIRGNGCESARSQSSRRFLAAEAPRLPLAGCSRARCACVYLHFEDRRHHTRRIGEDMQAVILPVGERRMSPGRRQSDAGYAM